MTYIEVATDHTSVTNRSNWILITISARDAVVNSGAIHDEEITMGMLGDLDTFRAEIEVSTGFAFEPEPFDRHLMTTIASILIMLDIIEHFKMLSNFKKISLTCCLLFKMLNSLNTLFQRTVDIL